MGVRESGSERQNVRKGERARERESGEESRRENGRGRERVI